MMWRVIPDADNHSVSLFLSMSGLKRWVRKPHAQRLPLYHRANYRSVGAKCAAGAWRRSGSNGVVEGRWAPQSLVGKQAAGQGTDRQACGTEAIADQQPAYGSGPAEQWPYTRAHRAETDSGFNDRRPSQARGDIQSLGQKLHLPRGGDPVVEPGVALPRRT
jgi:hypothetical protein